MGRNPNFVSHSINRQDNLIEKKVMTMAQQLNIKEFPFVIKDNKGNEIYYEESSGCWVKKEFDNNGKEIYWEDSNGVIINNRLKPVPEYTMEELVNQLGHNFKIKK